MNDIRTQGTGYVRTGSYRPPVPYRISVTIPSRDVPYRNRTVSTVSYSESPKEKGRGGRGPSQLRPLVA
jgi:hypothetical protein